jgi:hypothetical protein
MINRSILLIIKYAHEEFESIRSTTERSSAIIRFIPRPEDLHLIRKEMGNFRECLSSKAGAFGWNVYFGSDDIELERDFPDASPEELVLIPTSFGSFPRIHNLFAKVAHRVFGAPFLSRESDGIIRDLADTMEGDDSLIARTTYTVRDLLESLMDCEYEPEVLTESRLALLEDTERELLDSKIN